MVLMKNSAVYLDYQASTPVDARVMTAMEPFFSLFFANPHSTNHVAGTKAKAAVDQARRYIAQCINADSRSIVFTSGASEANNLAIQGVARGGFKKRKKRKRIVTLETEHSSVLQPVRELHHLGFDPVALPVKSSGVVDISTFDQAIDESTLLATVMHVNNETGIVQPISELAEICHNRGVIFHSDCAQSLGKTTVDVKALNVNLMTLSAHKAYGPKGVGVLYVRLKPRIPIQPILFGGGQERGLRPGTLPVPLCVGFGEACRIITENFDKDIQRIKSLSKSLVEGIFEVCPGTVINGDATYRVPGILNLRFPFGTSDELLQRIEGIQVSSGSACDSATIEPSKVLRAYGLSANEADASLRFGVGRFTSENDIQLAIDIVRNGMGSVERTRRIGASVK